MSDQGSYPPELMEAANALMEVAESGVTFEETMEKLALLAVMAIDGADACSVSLLKKGSDMSTVAATGDVAMKIDDLQREIGEGPGLSAIQERSTFHLPDMAEDTRWPKFSPKASEQTGVQSMLCYVLRLSAEESGAMNMQSTRKNGFSDEDLDTGALFAAQAAIAMGDALCHRDDQAQIDRLQEGMKTRQVIGEAVGLIMATRKIDSDEAFQTLVRASQRANIKIRVIAEKVVDNHRDI